MTAAEAAAAVLREWLHRAAEAAARGYDPDSATAAADAWIEAADRAFAAAEAGDDRGLLTIARAIGSTDRRAARAEAARLRRAAAAR